MGIALSIASMLCFAVNIFIVRAALARLDADIGFIVLLAMNTAFASLVFGVDLGIRSGAFAIQWTPLWLFALSGVIGIFLGRRMLLDSIRTLGPARSSVLHTVTPISTMVAAWAIAGERLGAYELAVMPVVIIGLFMLQPRVAGASLGPGLSRAAMHRGMLVAFGCIAGFGIGNALRGLAVQTWIEPAFASIVSSGSALLCQLAITPKWLGLPGRLAGADRRGLALYAASGIVTVCGSMFNTAAMAHVEISIVMLITYSTPLVVFPISVFLLKNAESLSPRNFAGAALALGGLALIVWR